MKGKNHLTLLLLPFVLINFFKSPFYQTLSTFLLNQSFRHINYFSPDGSWGGEELGGHLKLILQKRDYLAFKANLSLVAGQTLIDKWFFDWQQTPVKLDITGNLTSEKIFLEKGKISFANNLHLQMQGRLNLNPLSGDINYLILNVKNLSQIYSQLIKIPLKEVYPTLDKFDVKGKLDLSIKNTTYPLHQGNLNCKFQGDILLPYCQFKQVNLILPIFYNIKGQKLGFLQINAIFGYVLGHPEMRFLEYALIQDGIFGGMP